MTSTASRSPSCSYQFFNSLNKTSKNDPTNVQFHIKNGSFSFKSLKCITNSDRNFRVGSKSNGHTHNPEFSVSYSVAAIDSPLGAASTGDVSRKAKLLVSEFASLTEAIDRVKRLLGYAAVIPPFDESDRIRENQVTGCTTQVWLDVKMDEFGRMRFRADSDSEITKGFISCLIWMLDGAEPEEVLKVRSEDLTEMNIGIHGKAQSRVNTWHNILTGMQKRTKALVAERELMPPLTPLPSIIVTSSNGTINGNGSYAEAQVLDQLFLANVEKFI